MTTSTAALQPQWIERCPAIRTGRACCDGASLRITRWARMRTSRRCSTTTSRPAERYNMPDTLKAQHTAFLTAGCVCYSEHGAHLVLDHGGQLWLA